MKFNLRLIALLIAMLMLLTSCESVLEPLFGLIPGLQTSTTETTTTTPSSSSTTKKPDSSTTKKPSMPTIEFDVTDNSLSKDELLAMYTLTKEEVDAALALLDTMVETSKTASNVDEVYVLYEEFENVFYHIIQQNTVARIIYYYNMTDQESIERHLSTQEMTYSVQDKYNQSCRTMYLESPLSEEFFSDWSEEKVQSLLDYDPAIMEIQKEIDELMVQYDNLNQSDPGYNDACVEIYKQTIVKNNELARMHGYDNYYDYASVNAYGRDYAPEDLNTFRQYVAEYVVPYVAKTMGDYMSYRSWTSKTKKGRVDEFIEESFFATPKRNYLMSYLNSLEGSMGESMRHVFENNNCIFSFDGNSHPTAFQTYLYEDEKPFCFFGSNGQSANTVVHEIGHYYAGLKNPDIDNYDLCETHSQGNEFLFITYCEQFMDEDVYKAVRAYNLFNACYVIVMASVIDGFEQRVYELDDDTVMAMTGADFDAIMSDVCEVFGGYVWVKSNGSDPYAYWRLVAISNPVYYISYAVSAVAALEVGAMAEQDYEAALAAYTTLVEGVTYEDGFLGALAKAEFTTPFEEETFQNIGNLLAD